MVCSPCLTTCRGHECVCSLSLISTCELMGGCVCTAVSGVSGDIRPGEFPAVKPATPESEWNSPVTDQPDLKSDLTEDLSFTRRWIVVTNHSVPSYCVIVFRVEGIACINGSLHLYPECCGNEWRKWSMLFIVTERKRTTTTNTGEVMHESEHKKRETHGRLLHLLSFYAFGSCFHNPDIHSCFLSLFA